MEAMELVEHLEIVQLISCYVMVLAGWWVIT